MTNFGTGSELSMMAAVNRVINDLHDSLGVVESDFFCECGQIDCRERVKLTRAEYASLRDDDWPVLAADHAHRRPGVGAQAHELGVASRAPYGSGDPRGR